MMFQSTPKSLVGIGIRIVLLSSILLIAGCKQDNQWRQKLTLYVETPNGVVSGHGTTVVRTERRNNFANTGGNYSYIRGEGAIVELAPDTYLFSIVDPDMRGLLVRSMRAEGFFEDGGIIAPWQITEPLPVDFSHFSMLLSFTDINDPSTVFIVDPYDLEPSFGDGYKLISATVEGTDVPRGPSRFPDILPWYEEYVENHFYLNGTTENGWGPLSERPLTDRLRARVFGRGLDQ